MNFESINNYYEQRVIEKIQEMLLDEGLDDDQLQDIACIALNHLPTRYVRSTAIMDFFLTNEEKKQMEIEISDAIQQAKRFFLEQTAADTAIAK